VLTRLLNHKETAVHKKTVSHKKIAFFRGSLILAAVGFATASGVAAAEDRDSIVVESLQTTTHVTKQYSTFLREPREKFTTTVRVGYSDLDLTKNADVEKFQTRVKTAAQLACQKLDHVIPVEDLKCIDQALADLQPQMQSALHAAAIKAAQDHSPS
jgi:UrcA family protein